MINIFRLHIKFYSGKQLYIPKFEIREFIVINIRIAIFSKNNDIAVLPNISGTLKKLCSQITKI